MEFANIKFEIHSFQLIEQFCKYDDTSVDSFIHKTVHFIDSW